MSIVSGREAAVQTGIRRMAVAGNPNSGKTSIFNQLTGMRHKVANFPGVTVETREGHLAGSDLVLVDLPGSYSLSPRSPDEAIARDVLLGRARATDPPDAVLLVIDASNLERNLYLATQILEIGLPVVIAANMSDVAARRGKPIDAQKLSKELGVPVIPTVGSRGDGLRELSAAIKALSPSEIPQTARRWPLPEPFEQAVSEIAGIMESSDQLPSRCRESGSLFWLTDYLSGEGHARESAEAVLQAIPPASADAVRAAADRVSRSDTDPGATVIERRYNWISNVTASCHETPQAQSTTTDRIDAVVTHRIAGPLVFAGVMFALFLSIFSWAEPLMGLIEAGQMVLAEWVGSRMTEGALRSLLIDGVIAGVGSVVIFFPQICLLFLFISILEDSGYMARAAFLMDRVMSRAGLHGKSFIPLLSSYACAIPGIMGARTIENPRDRLTTIMVAPFMTCSARLPVYIIVIAAVFGDRAWLSAAVMFALYAFGTVTALVMALVFKKTLFAGPRPAFILELPPYHLPRLRNVFRVMWDRSKSFLTGAGTTIFAACVIMWALSYFPRLDTANPPPEVATKLAAALDDDAREEILASEQLRRSYLGTLGHAIEPVIRPLGYDWRLGTGILSSFLAREVFVGTMGITFAVGEADETSEALRDKLTSATWPDGSTILTPLVGVSLMVFYALACQCVSTLAVVKRETQTWRWPLFMFAYMTVMAYVASLAVYQIGTRMGWG